MYKSYTIDPVMVQTRRVPTVVLQRRQVYWNLIKMVERPSSLPIFRSVINIVLVLFTLICAEL